MKTRIFISLMMLIGLTSIVFSQKVASTSMQFLKVMPCARATAMGDAYTVWAHGAEAVFWNPSGVALTEGFQFTTTYTNWIFDAKQYAIGLAMQFGNFGSVGLQFQYVDYGSFEEALLPLEKGANPYEPYLTGRIFRPYSYLAGLTYARSLIEKFALGITVKYAHESLFDQKKVITLTQTPGIYGTEVKTYTDALLFDVGIRYNTGFRTVQVAASIQNFGPSFKYAVDLAHAPILFRTGIAGDIIGQNSLLIEDPKNRLGFAIELFQPNDYSQQIHTGFEYEFAKIIALRLGYKFNYDVEGLTFGVGIKQEISKSIILIDYSYGSMGKYLESAHRFSIGVQMP